MVLLADLCYKLGKSHCSSLSLLITWWVPRSSPDLLVGLWGAEGLVESCSPLVGPISHPFGNSPGSGTRRAACLIPPSSPAASREQGQRGEAGGDLAGRLCFQSWLSRAGAGEHTVPIRSPVLCCMCFHGFLGGGVERGDSSQSYSSQGLIKGDPSQVLTCVMEVPVTLVNPAPLLSAFWTGVWWPVSPGFPCGRGAEGS